MHMWRPEVNIRGPQPCSTLFSETSFLTESGAQQFDSTGSRAIMKKPQSMDHWHAVAIATDGSCSCKCPFK